MTTRRPLYLTFDDLEIDLFSNCREMADKRIPLP